MGITIFIAISILILVVLYEKYKNIKNNLKETNKVLNRIEERIPSFNNRIAELEKRFKFIRDNHTVTGSMTLRHSSVKELKNIKRNETN